MVWKRFDSATHVWLTTMFGVLGSVCSCRVRYRHFEGVSKFLNMLPNELCVVVASVSVVRACGVQESSVVMMFSILPLK